MSDTPRTDAVTKKSVDEDDGEYLTEDLLFHARELEREIRQLEVAIYDLKTENNLLQEALDQVIDDRDAYHEENNGLLKDKERLDWLIDNASISMLRKDEDGREWWVELDYSEPREDIDQAMEDAQ